MSVHFSSDRMDWPTPKALFDELNAEFGFTLDPCSSHSNAKCAKHFTPEDDGLAQSWAGEVVFMNPPYGRAIGAWMKKALGESLGAEVVCLVPSRTDTAWWHEYAMKADEIRYLRGRVKFEGAPNPAPFPSAVVVFRNKGVL